MVTLYILLGLLVVAAWLVGAQRSTLHHLRRVNAKLNDTLEAADEDLAYHQDVEDRLREVVSRLFGDDAVARIDEALWAADVACGLDKDTREWLEGKR